MNNSQLKYIKSLNRSKNRKELGVFFIEGKRLIESAILYGADIKNIYMTHDFFAQNATLVDSILKKNLNHTVIKTKQIEQISFTKTSSGIGAICKMPEKNILPLDNKCWLFLDGISDPGNMGTILRSAAYFNFINIALSKKCVDPFNPKVIRAGMGAHFRVSLIMDTDLNQFKPTHLLIGADQRGKNYKNFQYPEKYVIIFGNEAHGLTEDSLKSLDQFVSIEKKGFGESLNVASASSIIMHFLSER